ncbi:MAG: 3-deoxy-manno-octulosonate cytidylyltransferase [Candidatus Aminicenantales bacterium]
MRQATGIIPVRYESTRFPGKPLVKVQGKPLLQWVYEGVSSARLLERVIIATDDERILSIARKFGAQVKMTSANHRSGTERAAEVAAQLTTPIIVNIQGDEPLVRGEMIDSLVLVLQNKSLPMASLMVKDYEKKKARDPNLVKVVVDNSGFALFFSRSPLPSGIEDYFLKHIGLYGYQRDFLLKFASLKPSRLEKAEKLEQLRALEYGYRIKMVETDEQTLSINLPQDIIRLEKLLEMRNK